MIYTDRVLVVEYLISLPHALKIMQRLRNRVHKKLGWSYELAQYSELDPKMLEKMYSKYSVLPEYHLKVYRDRT